MVFKKGLIIFLLLAIVGGMFWYFSRPEKENAAEEQVDDGTHTCAEQGGGGAHAVADDVGDSDGSCHNGEELLEREDENLTKPGLVLDAVSEVHFLFLPLINILC